MKSVIIFGLNDFAELAYYYLTNDSDYKVVAFTVNQDYIDKKEFLGLPIVAFEVVENIYPPQSYDLFAPMSSSNMNRDREMIYNKGKSKGYEYITYVSSKATNLSSSIGDNCFILEDNTLQPFTKIGNNVVLWSGNHIGHHSEVKDHCFITSHVVISGHCTLNENSFLGVNSTLRDGCKLAKGTLIGMSSSLISKNTKEWSIYVGNPAKHSKVRKSYEVL